MVQTGSTGGVYSAAPAGLALDPATGAVNLGGSSAGSYTVTYSIAAIGECAAFSTVAGITLNTGPSAAISYPDGLHCTAGGALAVSRTGSGGGTYSASPAGLFINAVTGAITLGASTSGTYTVTYAIGASGGCPAFSTTAAITVHAVGEPCDDGDPATENDVITADCTCAGIPTAVAEQGPADGWLLWPNPAHGQVYLQMPGSGPVSIHVVDAEGRVVQQFNLVPAQGTVSWSTAQLARGAYAVHIMAPHAVRVLRLVVE